MSANINEGEPAKPHTLTLFVVRHGITEWNAVGRLQGQSDIPLSGEGQRQAHALGRRFHSSWSRTASGDCDCSARLPGPPCAVYTSDLSRARETAEIILAENPEVLHGATVRATPLLRERGFGEWEGLTAAEGLVRFGPGRNFHDEGETHDEVWNRMHTALGEIWDELMSDNSGAREKVALIVGHGGSLRQLVCIVNALPREAARRFTLTNTGLSVLTQTGTTLETADGRIRLWNDSSHLDDPAI